MANNPTIGVSLEHGPAPWRRQIHRGYVDAQNGVAWPRDYDVMSRSEQLAYESGRLLTRETMTTPFPLPVWRGDKAGCRPIAELWVKVTHAIGRSIVPPDWHEPTVPAP